MLPYSLLFNKTVSSHNNHTYIGRVGQPIKNKHVCTHGHMHTLWSKYTHTHTIPNVHTNTDTDATKQQQLKQQSDDNYCSCGVDAWRKCGLQMRGEVGPQCGGIMPWADRQQKSFFKVCRGAAGLRRRGQVRQKNQTLKSNQTRRQVAAPLLRNNAPVAAIYSRWTVIYQAGEAE